ncbi:acriflavine resistance protein B [Xanthomonas hortorum pv. carotae str. M081]|nr:acriflavine resistance protein B [Xanthomonas hortorum pv. carotae str. M081]
MARFFIDRPIFAWVIAIVITLAGAISIFSLPLEQYPDIAPPSVTVSATYTGASAETVQNSVTQILEQQMTGLDNLLYMSSSSSSAGTAQLTLTFESGTDPDTAQVQVQNKVSQGEALLPDEVKTNGITVTKSASGSMFMVLAFTSEDGSMDSTDIGDYMVSSLQDPISRLNGIGSVNVFGAEYAMRVWLDPEKLHTYALMPSDVSTAIAAQNADVSSGALGALPALQGQQLNATVTSRSKLRTPAQFENIVLKSDASGATVYLRDVARVELGSESYGSSSKFNGKAASGMGLQLATGANARDAAKLVEAKLDALKPYFPAGLKYEVAYDTTPFVRISIEEVVKTLIEAIVLVVVVMYLFLQNWRATLVPVIAVPVVLMGTFGVLSLLGFSINTLTMFAMVLAIGLLVDDAIVVVENVERLMAEQGMSPREATHTSMGQITGALVGIALVLTAVFLPMAFFGGATGEIYRQFSVTIAAAMILSLVVALTLSPALCATLLKPIDKGGHVSRKGVLGRFFTWFNTRFDRGTDSYGRGVELIVSHRRLGSLIYVVLLVVLGVLFWRLPSAFLPEEDQGMLMVMFSAPAGATQQRTQQSIDQATQFILKQPEVQGIMTISGFSLAGSSQNSGMGFIRLKDWADRDGSAQEVAQRITGAMMMTLAGCAGVCVDATGHQRLGHQLRFHPAIAGCRRQRPRGLGGSTQAVAAAGQRQSEPECSAFQRAGRRAYLPRADRRCQGRCVGRGRRRHQHHAIHSDGRALRQRLPQQQPGQACVRAGRGVRAHVAQRYRALVRAQQRCRDGAVLGVRQQRLGLRTASADALQRQRIDGNHRQRRTGHQLGRCDDGGGRRSGWHGQGRGLRLVGHVVSGAGRRHPDLDVVCSIAGVRVPVSGGAVRELVDPDLGDAGGAGRHCRRAAGDLDARSVQRHLLPGGLAGDDGAGRQERHPDRGICQGAGRKRPAVDRSHPACRPHAFAPDPDDLAGLHARRAADGDQQRRRLRWASFAGHRRARRHPGLHGAGHLLRAAVLRDGAQPVSG